MINLVKMIFKVVIKMPALPSVSQRILFREKRNYPGVS